LDILCVTTYKGLLTEAETNQLFQKITHNQESHLCCKSIEEHRRLHFGSMKINY